MRESYPVLAAAGVSAAAVTGSALTAEDTIPDTVSGDGESTITGAVVTEIDLVALAADGVDCSIGVWDTVAPTHLITRATADATLSSSIDAVGLTVRD